MAEAPVPDRPNIHNQLATGLEGSLGSNAQRCAGLGMHASIAGGKRDAGDDERGRLVVG